eukprot:5768768-Pleurochrysis_carterae.AAC.1
MRPGTALASSQPASRYAAAYEAELRGLGGRKLSAGLWRLAPSRAVDDDNLDSGPWIHAADAEAVRVLMYPLCRCANPAVRMFCARAYALPALGLDLERELIVP